LFSNPEKAHLCAELRRLLENRLGPWLWGVGRTRKKEANQTFLTRNFAHTGEKKSL